MPSRPDCTVGAVEAELRDIIREEVRTAVRLELGNKPAAAGDFVGVGEAARIASVSPQTIRAWMRSGKLNEYKAGRVRRVKRTELEAFLSAGPTSDTRGDASPEDLADRRFHERQARRRGAKPGATLPAGKALR